MRWQEGKVHIYLYSPFSDKVLAAHVGGFLSEGSLYYKSAVKAEYLAIIHNCCKKCNG